MEKNKIGRARHFTSRLLRESIALWQKYQAKEISLLAYRRRGRKLQSEINHHLRDRSLSDGDNQRLLDGIGMQADRGRLTLFLRHPGIEPTNNLAERGLRPAVIARKVSHCSKNERGAKAYSVLKSIFTTLSLRTDSMATAMGKKRKPRWPWTNLLMKKTRKPFSKPPMQTSDLRGECYLRSKNSFEFTSPHATSSSAPRLSPAWST